MATGTSEEPRTAAVVRSLAALDFVSLETDGAGQQFIATVNRASECAQQDMPPQPIRPAMSGVAAVSSVTARANRATRRIAGRG